MFRHYESKDPGRLFHTKLLLAFDSAHADATPLWAYVGSANFSKGAWGVFDEYLWLKINNIECGVVVKGESIPLMLEDGGWEELVSVAVNLFGKENLKRHNTQVPYNRPARPYEQPVDRPFNSRANATRNEPPPTVDLSALSDGSIDLPSLLAMMAHEFLGGAD
jgi:tyrosyl-DNA phosphodiesterase-1